jgi:glycosyltransferase involved in cell wall biosynthesis
MTARLEDLFDCVVFLTQSEWKTEPRSNRYHYATRFAARLPTYFVQPDGPSAAIRAEPAAPPGLTLVHCDWDGGQRSGLGLAEAFHGPPAHNGPAPAQALADFLAAKGVRRPLLWIYSFGYTDFIAAHGDAFAVFHATEDYTLAGEAARIFDEDYRDRVYAGLKRCDLLVAVSDAVRDNYLARTPFGGRAITLPNGCDFRFWEKTQAWDYRPQQARRGLLDRFKGAAAAPLRPTILYQGGINDRLDLEVLERLVQAMPDVDFAFCGRVSFAGKPDGQAAWDRLLQAPNLRYHGEVTSEEIAALSRGAAVGLIPYRDLPMIAVSLPLKAYEYLACGLPVVSVPIPALERAEGDFAFARTADEYEAAIRRAIPARADPAVVQARLAAARAMDYDQRFRELEAVIAEQMAKPRAAKPAPAETALRVWSARDATCLPPWEENGAGVAAAADGVCISMPYDGWNPGGLLPLRLAPAAWSEGPLTLAVSVSGVNGSVRLGLSDGGGGQIACETPLRQGQAVQQYRLLLRTPPEQSALLFRSGEEGGGSACLEDVRLLSVAG